MIVVVTLTSPGASTGPFNLFSSANLVTPLATGVSRTALVAGYTLNSVPDAATYIRVTSTGTCTNSLNINITSPTTTTTTTTSDPYEYYLADEYYCPTCGVNATGVLVKVPIGSSLIPNRFYKSFDVSNYIYKITDTGQGPGIAITLNTTQYLDCLSAGCGTLTTTTTLPVLNAISLGYDATDAVLACSATNTTYYMYESTFLTASTLYNDINGTSVAADGQYSNGGVRVREQYLGTLGTSAPC